MAVKKSNAVIACATVLAKLDPQHDPHYKDDAFLSPESRGALTNKVRAVIHVMTSPSSVQGWCEQINDVHKLEAAFFDTKKPNNHGLEDFRKDWNRVREAAGCPSF